MTSYIYAKGQRDRQQGSKAKSAGSKLRAEFNWVRWGLFAGVGAITLSSAFMNVSGWVSMASTPAQALANGALSGGMEGIAIFGLPFAGFMMRNGNYGKGFLALAVVAAAIAINVYATHNFLDVQLDTAVNDIETSGAEAGNIDAQINVRQREIDSIIKQNNGNIPRDIETIKNAYSHLDPESNPINMRNRDAEIGQRLRYEELQFEINELRNEKINPSIESNDLARSVIPPENTRLFVITLELMKAIGLYILGNSTLFWSAKAKADYQRKRKYAIIRQRQQEKQQQIPRRRTSQSRKHSRARSRNDVTQVTYQPSFTM